MDTNIQMPPSVVPPPGKSQPIQSIVVDDSPMLDDNAVRAAIAQAEANNQDPMTIRTDELSQGQIAVPDKFRKPDGTVDVDKIQASTKALEEGIQKKEEAITKTTDDYMRAYNEEQNKFRNMPNAERVLAQAPRPVDPLPEASVTSQIPDYERIVREDYNRDPLGTTTRLLDLMLQKKFEPLEQREKTEATRSHIQELANKDPRFLREDVFAAVNAELKNDPDLWKLKNPHRQAFLRVKEEMRLGDAPQGAQAQPRLSPVLGGGTPPSVPSAQVPSQQNVLSNLDALDLRDKNQEALGDEALRRALMGNRS